MCSHIKESGPLSSGYQVDTVYIGGGTPSYMGADSLAAILTAIRQSFDVSPQAEITFEANPDSVTLKLLRRLKSEGFNRLSIGAQSANDDILKLIGRRHNWAQVEQCVRDARRAGFRNISIDLIYGLPSQTKSDWADTLRRAIDLKVDHISCYGLKLEEGTPMYEYRGSPFLPDEDEQADMYLYAVETLANNGYKQYEISNFCRKKKYSKHNLKYWLLRDYMGFGPGAHSNVAGIRYSYVRDLVKYINGINANESIIDEYEKIGLLDRAAEYIMLGMRTSKGISQKEYYKIYRCDFEPMEELLKEFQRKGWAITAKGRWRFTAAGFLLSNLLIGLMLERQAEHKRSGNPWTDSFDSIVDDDALPEGDEVFYRS